MHDWDASERLVDEDEAARALGVKRRTLQAWRLAGRGPAWVQLGRCIRYRPQDLSRFVSLRRRGPSGEAA